MRRSFSWRAQLAFPPPNSGVPRPDLGGWAILLASLLTLAASGAMQPASAQGLFETLFGSSTPRSASPPPIAVHRGTDPENRSLPPAPLRAGENTPAPRERGGTFRTVCVRMCDGYYFPISNAVRRSQLGRDIKLCDTRCGAESKLFMLPTNSSADANEMTDVMGRRYAQLPNAFKYRKKLVAGCQCKPQPWAASERMRHMEYAALDAQAKARGETLLAAADQPPKRAPGTEPMVDESPRQALAALREDLPAAPLPAAASAQPTVPAASGDLLSALTRTTDEAAVAAVVRATEKSASKRPAPAARPKAKASPRAIARAPQAPARRPGPTTLASSAQRWPGD